MLLHTSGFAFRYPAYLYLKEQNPSLLPHKPGLCSHAETTPWAGCPCQPCLCCPLLPCRPLARSHHTSSAEYLQPPLAVISTCVMTPQTHRAASLSLPSFPILSMEVWYLTQDPSLGPKEHQYRAGTIPQGFRKIQLDCS